LSIQPIKLKDTHKDQINIEQAYSTRVRLILKMGLNIVFPIWSLYHIK